MYIPGECAVKLFIMYVSLQNLFYFIPYQPTGIRVYDLEYDPLVGVCCYGKTGGG